MTTKEYGTMPNTKPRLKQPLTPSGKTRRWSGTTSGRHIRSRSTTPEYAEKLATAKHFIAVVQRKFNLRLANVRRKAHTYNWEGDIRDIAMFVVHRGYNLTLADTARLCGCSLVCAFDGCERVAHSLRSLGVRDDEYPRLYYKILGYGGFKSI